VRAGVLVLIAGCGRLGFDPRAVADGSVTPDTPAPPTGPHVELRLDRMAPGETLVDFPLPVVLDAAHVGAGPPRFFTDDGVEFAAEIEAIGPPVRAWVRVPQIAGTSTQLTAIFAGSAPASSDAWTASYEGVWHLADPAHDSSSHARTATVVGTSAATSPAGPARHFTGASGDGIVVAAGASVAFPAITVSAWCSVHTVATPNAYVSLVTRERLPDFDDDFYLGVHMSQPYFFVQTTGTSTAPGGTNIVLDQWRHYAASYDGMTARFYIDGVAMQTTTASGAVLTDPTPFMFGCDRNTSTSAAGTCDSDYLDGDLDEIRIESVARSGAWLAYEHAAMLDQVITYEPLVAAP
jgi:hypothetical protein